MCGLRSHATDEYGSRNQVHRSKTENEKKRAGQFDEQGHVKGDGPLAASQRILLN